MAELLDFLSANGLIILEFCGSIKAVFKHPFYAAHGKEATMGKSLNGKELGKGISRRKDAL